MQKTFNRRKTYFWCTATKLIVEVQTQYSKELLTCISCYENYIFDIIYHETCITRQFFSQNSSYNETLFLFQERYLLPRMESFQQQGASIMEENVAYLSYQFKFVIVVAPMELIVEAMESQYIILDLPPNVTWDIVLEKDFHAQMAYHPRMDIHLAPVSS